MKIYIPIVYGVAVTSAVAYYVSSAHPNSSTKVTAPKVNSETVHSSPLVTTPENKSLEKTAPKKVQKIEEKAPEETEIKKIDPDLNLLASTQAEGIKASPNKALIDPKNNKISADESVIYGSLENGMRYIILKNLKPEKRVSMRLHVGAGSLNEADNQRGVAHFLEHMVFNGTKNFPNADKLIPRMQRLGIAFGAHANAYTSFDETVYMLDLPNIKDGTLDLAFKVMQDFAGGALLEKSEIDEERGVISSEKTSRDSVQYRLMEQQFKAMLPESLIINRFPIGTEKVIQNAKRERFVDFYERFYRPKNMCFVYVGDIDEKDAKANIEKYFGHLKEPTNPGPKPSVGKITTGKGFQTAVFSDKEVTSSDVSISSVRKYKPQSDTATVRASRLPLSIANQILSKRFSNLTLDDPDTPILSGSSMRNVMFKELEFGSIDVTAKDNNWKAALPVLVREYKRTMQHGFTEKEVKDIKASYITAYENRVKAKASRKSPSLASSLVSNHHNNTVFSTPERDLAIIKEALGNITPESCHQAFFAFWSTPDIFLSLTTQTEQKGDKQLLASIFKNEVVKKTEPPKVEVKQEFAYTDFGDPGKITRTIQVPDLDFTQLVLSNGIRVNLKKTDFAANSISMIASMNGGVLTQPKGKPGIGKLAGVVMNIGGLGKHSTKDLKSLLAGKSVGLRYAAGEDRFNISGSTTKEDLELQLQLLTASLSDPGYRPEAERLFRSQLPMEFKRLEHSQAGGLSKMQETLRASDVRFTNPTKEQYDQISTTDVKNWLQPHLESSYLEISIVGDFDQKHLVELLLKTVGTLPKRNNKPNDNSAEGKLGKVDFPIRKTFTFDSKVPNAIVVDAWRCGNTGKDIKKTRRLNVLSDIIGDRMRVKLREDLGMAYSPGAQVSSSSVFENSSYILAYCPGKPKDVDKLSEVIVAIADKLAKEGATQDELDRALTPTLSGLDKSKKTNSYWLSIVMDFCQTKPGKLDYARNRDKDYKSITLKQVNELAASYLGKKNVAEFIIKPKAQ